MDAGARVASGAPSRLRAVLSLSPENFHFAYIVAPTAAAKRAPDLMQAA
jgi:hypothetical protein